MLRTNLSRRRLLLPALLLLAGVALAAPAAASAQTFSNNAGIAINDGNCDDLIQAQATPYPSTIAVSGLAAVQDVNVTLSGFTHSHPADVRVLLVGPQGQTTLLLHKNGGPHDVSNLSLSFDDAAAAPPSTDFSALASGSYKPSNQSEGPGGCELFSAASSFPAPAPAGPYGSTLGGFNASDPNGDWKLYVVDEFAGDTGSITGWSLDITAAGGFDPAVLAAIFAEGGKDAANAYCESLKESAEDKDAGEAEKEACDRALEELEAAADED